MTIPIMGEPSPVGFCAKTGGPLDLSAESGSAAEAVHALREKIARRLEDGAMLIDHPVSAPASPLPVLSLPENPLFDAWLTAVETYRAERENREGSAAGEAQ